MTKTPDSDAKKHPYIGRFAPSPTGPLHIGSLMTAVASFLDARAHNGTWLVRMEDLDPPRTQPGAAERILDTLQFYGLDWDGDVLYQSQRSPLYQSLVDQLLQQQNAFYCTCSRTDIFALTGSATYPGTCRRCYQKPQKPAAIRIKVSPNLTRFHDLLQGWVETKLDQDGGDFVIQRKDGLFAYHLAVVLDDAAQGVTHIVRGCDLLDSAFRHRYLQTLLQLPHPVYAHLPVIVNPQGQKLSKQTHAEAIPLSNPLPHLHYCLRALGQKPPQSLLATDKETLLAWALEQWQIQRVPHRRSLQQPTA